MRYLPLLALLGFFLASADELPAQSKIESFNYERCLQIESVSVSVREAITICNTKMK